MDDHRVDRLARALTDTSARRALLRLAMALPLVGWLVRRERGPGPGRRGGLRCLSQRAVLRLPLAPRGGGGIPSR